MLGPGSTIEGPKNTIVNKAARNFMTETEAKRLNILRNRDIGQMQAVNLVTILVLGVAKRTPINIVSWMRLDFVIIKIDDFNILLGMDLLLEYKIIFMLLVKCLIVIGSNPTIIQTLTRQLKEVKMMSAQYLVRDLTNNEPRSLPLSWLKSGAQVSSLQ